MSDRGQVRFKIATEPAEFEQVFELAYDTFVEEIPQHQPNATRRHVDRFHAQNLYIIALSGSDVVGMITMRGDRPFSLDEKLGGVDRFLPEGHRICELRLLAVRPAHRRGMVFRGLVERVVREGHARGYDLAIISGTVRQAKLYQHLGFTPFGPVVGSADAPFQPMYLTLEKFLETAPAITARPELEPISFLPGPVPVAESVRAAFVQPPAYHRDTEFCEAFQRVKVRLCALASAPRVEILLGSGTLANDVVAAQLSRFDAPGVVVSNGEFGQRLIDQAGRQRLRHTPVAFPWGQPLDADRIQDAIRGSDARWLWAVASETSTGMLNDLESLKALAREHDVALCLDCVSAIGAVPLDLDGVFLASGASGKALASYPGLSFVFYGHDVASEPARIPRYLDLGYYAEKGGIPFTQSSNLVAALEAALTRFQTSEPFERLTALSRCLRARLRELDAPVLVDEAVATPAVVTLALPADRPAAELADHLRHHGLVVAYQSEYLAQRNWLQVSLMGHDSFAPISRLIAALAGAVPVWRRHAQIAAAPAAVSIRRH